MAEKNEKKTGVGGGVGEKKRSEKSQIKNCEMLGKWGKWVYNYLAHRDLFASPHFGQ
jgi:hypothetical protein